MTRLVEIALAEGIGGTVETVEMTQAIGEETFPKIRKAIGVLQQS